MPNRALARIQKRAEFAQSICSYACTSRARNLPMAHTWMSSYIIFHMPLPNELPNYLSYSVILDCYEVWRCEPRIRRHRSKYLSVNLEPIFKQHVTTMTYYCQSGIVYVLQFRQTEYIYVCIYVHIYICAYLYIHCTTMQRPYDDCFVELALAFEIPVPIRCLALLTDLYATDIHNSCFITKDTTPWLEKYSVLLWWCVSTSLPVHSRVYFYIYIYIHIYKYVCIYSQISLSIYIWIQTKQMSQKSGLCPGHSLATESPRVTQQPIYRQNKCHKSHVCVLVTAQLPSHQESPSNPIIIIKE